MCDEFKSALVHYLKKDNLYPGDENCPWEMVELPVLGRGLIAKRDIHPNEVIFYDRPLIVGPRAINYDKIFCVSCYTVLSKLTLCSKMCKLPICHNCENLEAHRLECELIHSWKLKTINKYSKHLFRALTVIRGLILSKDDTNLMHMMACHDNTPMQNIEIDKCVVEFEELSSDCEDIKKLKKVSSILNTNAFEVGLPHDSQPEHGISLRGLYPLSAVMNHNCKPNIYYVYDDKKVMNVKASKLIKKGEQIFNSYTKFLWGTQQRRVHLAYSKNFLCKCDRCVDRTELNSFISGIKCIKATKCDGIMLPINPLVIKSAWKCEKCDLQLNHARISNITDILSKQIFNRILKEPMSLINQYLKEKLHTFLPDSNQFVIELKLQIMLKMKKEQNYIMSNEDYQDIERYCENVLEIIDKLELGECFIKGILYHELITTKLKLSELQEVAIDEETKIFIYETLTKCWNILGQSISEPKDLKELLETFK